MDSTAINLIQQTAIKAAKANVLDTATPAIVLQDRDGRQHVESIEHLREQRSRFRGTYSTSSPNDFAQYVIAHRGARGFIDVQRMRAVAFFNLGSNDEDAGHADHYAQLTLSETAAFKAVRAAISVSQIGQKTLVNWVEDWADNLQPNYPDGVDTGAEGVQQALATLRKVKIKASREAVHTDKDFGASRSALEDIEASSAVGLPRGFRFTCVSHEGLPEYAFYLRLGVKPDPDNPGFTLRVPRIDADLEALGQSFKTVLLDAIGDKATMLLGTFEPGK